MGKKTAKNPRKKKAPAPAASPPQAPAADTPLWLRVLREPMALGLAVLILIRPWLDGITYPTDNFYFVWGLALLFALWAARMLLRGEAIRSGIPIALLAAFCGIALVTAVDTVQFDATYRTLLLWAGHFMLFVVATNGVRSRMAIGLVLGAFAVSALAETVWSLIHLKYVIPLVREAVKADPRLLVTYFGSTELNPELVYRLQVNRAFGSLLFPNALAAFLILGIPCALTWAVRSLVALRRDAPLSAEARNAGQSGGLTPGKKKTVEAYSGVLQKDLLPASQGVSFVAGLVAWLLAVCVLYFVFSFIATFEFPLPEGMFRFGPLVAVPGGGYGLARAPFVLGWTFFVVLLPLAVGAVVFFILRRCGLRVFADTVCAAVLVPLFAVQLWALWRTYSRGGVLALAAAVVFTVALLWFGKRLGAALKLPTASRTAAAGILIAMAVPVLMVAVDASAGPGEVEKAAPAGAPATKAETPARLQKPRPQSPRSPITKDGIDLTLEDLANPASFRLRLTYWQTGFDMAMANLLTGVGLGNFGAVYPKYQRLGAGDVKAAHNDYLQALCETGILGFLLFCSFWAYFFLFGAWRLLRENDPQERLLLAGLYTGVLAFLIHSVVDFNFFNPALAFFVFLLAGVFFSRSSLNASQASTHPQKSGARYQLIALPMLVTAALIAGLALRVFLCDYFIGGKTIVNVGNRRLLNTLYDATNFLMSAPQIQRQGRKPTKDIPTLAKLVDSRSELEGVGTIRVPAAGAPSGHRALRPEEPVTDDAFIIITEPVKARVLGRKYAERWLDAFEAADRVFPHDPEIAEYFIRWYDLIVTNTYRVDIKKHYLVQFLKWAEVAVERSPHQSMYREWLAKALFLRGSIEAGAAKKKFFDRAVAEYKRATELYPVSISTWRKYGDAAIKYGKALKEAGDTAAGEARITEGQDAMRRAAELTEMSS